MAKSKNSQTVRNTAGNSGRLFDATWAVRDQAYIDGENDLPELFQAVCLSNATTEEVPATDTASLKLAKICVKPVATKPIVATNGEILYRDEATPVPGDTLPRLEEVKDTEELHNMLRFYHTLEYMIATAEDSSAIHSPIQFGQIVNCKFLYGSPNHGTGRALVFEVPQGDPIMHPNYVGLLSNTRKDSAKEPFSSSPAVLLSQMSSGGSSSGGASGPMGSSTDDELAELRRIIKISNSDEKYRELTKWKNNKGTPQYGGTRVGDFDPASWDIQLYDLVAAHESGKRYGAANNIHYPDGKGGRYVVKGFGTPFTPGEHPAVKALNKTVDELTIGELKSLQGIYKIKRYPTKETDIRNSIFAAGKYQIIPRTLSGILPKIPEITDDAIFDKATQDKMMTYLIYGGKKRKWLSDYLLGGSAHIDAALVDLAQEFSSVCCPDGLGFYGNETARNKPEDVKAMLKSIRDKNARRTGSTITTGDIANGNGGN